MFDGNFGATVLDQRTATKFTAPSSPSCTQASLTKFLTSHNSSVWKSLNFVHHLLVRMFSPLVFRTVSLWVWACSRIPLKQSLQLLFWNCCWTFYFLSVFNQAWNFLPLEKPLKSSHFLWIIHLWTTLLYPKKRTIFCQLETHASFWTEINLLIKLIRSTIPPERVRENMRGYKLNHRIQ